MCGASIYSFLDNQENSLLLTSLSYFDHQAFEEVQGFFSSSCPTSVLSDLANTLDLKRQVVDKVSALLKELTVGMYESSYPNLGSSVKLQKAKYKTNATLD